MKLRAELDRIRAQGWALVDQELEEGLRSVAAPIRDRAGRVVAAVNVSAHASRASRDTVRRVLLPPLLATAAAHRDRPARRRIPVGGRGPGPIMSRDVRRLVRPRRRAAHGRRP